MPKEDSEIFQGYSAINPNINDDKPGSGNQQTDKVKFRTSRRRKPSGWNSRDNLGEYLLNNILGNNQQGISNNRMNMLSQKRWKYFLTYSFLGKLKVSLEFAAVKMYLGHFCRIFIVNRNTAEAQVYFLFSTIPQKGIT